MIAKPALLILGMINESPKGAYEINKLLGQMYLKWWLKISSSSVYVTTRNLEEKNYIKGHTEKNSNMPERTVYSITPKGNAVLTEAIREAFCSIDFDMTTFSVAMIYMSALEKSELSELIERRKELLKEYLIGIDENMSELSSHVKPHILLDVDRMKHMLEAELNCCQQLSEPN